MRFSRYSVSLLVLGGVVVILAGCSTKQPALCTESVEPVTARSTSAPKGAPAQRVDGRVFGQIVDCETKTGEQLGMEPGDMIIYVIEFRVDQSEHDKVSHGQMLTLYSKLPVNERLGKKSGWVQVATYSTRPAWLISYE